MELMTNSTKPFASHFFQKLFCQGHACRHPFQNQAPEQTNQGREKGNSLTAFSGPYENRLVKIALCLSPVTVRCSMFGCSVFGVRVRDACSVFCSVFGLNACCVRSHVRLERLFVFVERCSVPTLAGSDNEPQTLCERIFTVNFVENAQN